MEYTAEPEAGEDMETLDAVQEGLAALEEGDIPQGTTEPVAPGQTGDPLEVLYKAHPETLLDYAEKIAPLLPLRQVPPDQPSLFTEDATTGDPYHTSQPFMSVFERTKILGFRTNQLAQGARPYIVVPEHVTSTLDIARMELEQRRLPYIIKRPMPNGTFEYWRLNDMMVI